MEYKKIYKTDQKGRKYLCIEVKESQLPLMERNKVGFCVFCGAYFKNIKMSGTNLRCTECNDNGVYGLDGLSLWRRLFVVYKKSGGNQCK